MTRSPTAKFCTWTISPAADGSSCPTGPTPSGARTGMALARWIGDHGYRTTAYPRELYLECPDDEDKWVTELQEPITTA
jgi:hypothetical protein